MSACLNVFADLMSKLRVHQTDLVQRLVTTTKKARIISLYLKEVVNKKQKLLHNRMIPVSNWLTYPANIHASILYLISQQISLAKGLHKGIELKGCEFVVSRKELVRAWEVTVDTWSIASYRLVPKSIISICAQIQRWAIGSPIVLLSE